MKFITCFEDTAAAFNNLIPRFMVSSQFLLLLFCLNPRLSSKCLRLTGGGERIQAFTQTQMFGCQGQLGAHSFVCGPFTSHFLFFWSAASCLISVACESVCQDELNVATSPSSAVEAGLGLPPLSTRLSSEAACWVFLSDVKDTKPLQVIVTQHQIKSFCLCGFWIIASGHCA